MKRIVGIIGLAALAVLLMGTAFGLAFSGNQAISRTFWPEKEGVSVIRASHLSSQDPCVTRTQLQQQNTRPRAC